MNLNVIEQLELSFRDTYMQYYYHFHKNPEPSYLEEKTAGYVAEKIHSMPFDDIKTGVGGYGVTALLRGTRPGPVIAVRADMDAMNIKEATGAGFASATPGVMHACGHDSHTAMLLGAAHVLSSLKNELPGAVKFIFQPSEEMTPLGGALCMIRDKVLEAPKVDAIIGIHVWPAHETGQIGSQEGVVSAASDRVKIRIKGQAAHASMPHEGTDAIVAAASVITALQNIISRDIDPRDTVAITIGTIQGGARHNILPEEVLLEGTVRTFDPAVAEIMPKYIERTVVNTARAAGAEAEIEYKRVYPPVVNDPAVSKICRDAITEIVGKKGLLPVQGVPANSEDFSFFARQLPAAFAWLGCRPVGVAPQNMPPLHNSKFLPDPKVLPIGVKYLSAAVIKLLSEFGK